LDEAKRSVDSCSLCEGLEAIGETHTKFEDDDEDEEDHDRNLDLGDGL
jgi:hypothetical protein